MMTTLTFDTHVHQEAPLQSSSCTENSRFRLFNRVSICRAVASIVSLSFTYFSGTVYKRIHISSNLSYLTIWQDGHFSITYTGGVLSYLVESRT